MCNNLCCLASVGHIAGESLGEQGRGCRVKVHSTGWEALPRGVCILLERVERCLGGSFVDCLTCVSLPGARQNPVKCPVLTRESPDGRVGRDLPQGLPGPVLSTQLLPCHSTATLGPAPYVLRPVFNQ